MSNELAKVENTGGALALIRTAIENNADTDYLRELFALQKDWEANEARKAFVKAMAAFKAEHLTIAKDKKVNYATRDGDKVNYTHATIGNVVAVVVPALAMHGLSHRWETKQSDGGMITVTCILTHEAGHSESTTLYGLPDNSGKKNPIQQIASTVSYLQRYTLLAATGLATSDQPDDDGAGGVEIGVEEARIMQSWIDVITAATDVATLAKLKKEYIDDYKGLSNVPQQIKDAYANRLGELKAPA